MIVLVNHPGLRIKGGLQIQSPAPPIGLAYLGAYIKQNGVSYTAIDACGMALDKIFPYPGVEDALIQGLNAQEVLALIPKDTRIVGFTCLFSYCWNLVLDLASEVRKAFPNVIIVAGGEHPTALPESVFFKKGIIDLIIYGEGEETLLELVHILEWGKDWQNIAGVIYENDGVIVKNPPRKRVKNIDQFPFPDWDSWCIREYISSNQVSGINLGTQMPILGSRGCPYACTFCSNELMWGRCFIMRSSKSIVDEMECMKKKYGVEGFTFMDSTFIVNRRKTIEFCDELISRKININYQLPAGTRCEAFNEELVFKLEKSGLKNFALAPESGSSYILKITKKQIDINNLIYGLKYILKTHMTVGCFIVIGFPEDNEKTMKETLKLVRRIAILGVHDITVSQFVPYPGTQYFHRFQKEGLFSKNYSELVHTISFFEKSGVSFCKTMSKERLYFWMIYMFWNFYIISFSIRPWRFMNNLLSFFAHGVENTRYMRFFSTKIRLFSPRRIVKRIRAR